MKKQPAQNLPLYELKITLRGSKPAIWRRVQVPGSINLTRLHDVFQVVTGCRKTRAKYCWGNSVYINFLLWFTSVIPLDADRGSYIFPGGLLEAEVSHKRNGGQP